MFGIPEFPSTRSRMTHIFQSKTKDGNWLKWSKPELPMQMKIIHPHPSGMQFEPRVSHPLD